MSDVPPVEPDPGSMARFAVHEHHAPTPHVDCVDDAPVDPDDPDGPIRKSIWDTGTYTVVRATHDKLVFDLDGQPGSAR